MKALKTQRRLAAELLNVGENKVIFDSLRLEDISKAITRIDIAELIKDKAIMKKITGKSKKKKEEKRRGTGSIKVRVKNRKSKYIARIRKIRRYLNEIRKKNLKNNEYHALRRLAKAGQFKSRRHLKEYLTTVMHKKIEEKKQ